MLLCTSIVVCIFKEKILNQFLQRLCNGFGGATLNMGHINLFCECPVEDDYDAMGCILMGGEL